MSDFDFDLLNELVEDAPTAGFGPQRQFGKMAATVTVLSWKDGKPTEVPFTNQKLSNGEYLRLNFESDLSELNPMLTNPYKRRVDVKKSGNKAKTDFSETVEPSLKSLLGKDWAKKLVKGFYAEWEDAETVEVNRQGELKGWDSKPDESGKTKHYTNTVPRFLRVFKSKAECETARAERFTRKENGTLDLTSDDGIPSETVNEARGLIQAVGLEQARTILSNTSPYNQYDLEKLIEVANPL